MKKLLILAYDFPPYISVGGLRPYSWYKYMHEYGIFPVVVTRQWANKYGNHLDYIAPSESNKVIIEENEKGIIIRTPYKPNLSNRLLLKYGESRFKFIRKIITGWYEFFQWFLPVGSKYFIYKAAKEYLKTNKVDCIIATGDPFILFRYASLISKKFNIPWIADYRDAWIETKKLNILFIIFYKFLEKRIVRNSSKITTASDYLNFFINNNFKVKINVVFNGYNVDNGISEKEEAKNNILSISFAGTINKWHSWKSFLEIINSFCRENKFKINLNFYGINIKYEIEKFVKNSQMQKSDFLKINFYPRMLNEKLLIELQKSDLFLLFNDFHFIGTKIFDYLGLRKKILFIFMNDSEMNCLKELYFPHNDVRDYNINPQIELIKKCKTGYIANNKEHLYEILIDIKREFEEKGYIECNSSGYEFYSRKNQTKLLAELIKEVINEQ